MPEIEKSLTMLTFDKSASSFSRRALMLRGVSEV